MVKWGQGRLPHNPDRQPVMSEITREQLDAYLDDALTEGETAHIEQALRNSDALRLLLRTILQERDRGEHSIGAVWRRERLSCPTREELGSYLLQVLEAEHREYIDFHLQVIACPYCQANLADLQARQKEPAPSAQERQRRLFQSSAAYLQPLQEPKRGRRR
jgi:DNA-binding phage protein